MELKRLAVRRRLDDEALPKLKAKIQSLNMNEAEKARVMEVFKQFEEHGNLHALGMTYLRYFERTRELGPPEKKRAIPCPFCGSEDTMELPRVITEVFRQPVYKDEPDYARYMEAPKITRGWSDQDSRGNSKITHAEYKAIAYTHHCGPCNALFSFPSIERATRAHFGQSPAEKIMEKFDAKVVPNDPTIPF